MNNTRMRFSFTYTLQTTRTDQKLENVAVNARKELWFTRKQCVDLGTR